MGYLDDHWVDKVIPSRANQQFGDEVESLSAGDVFEPQPTITFDGTDADLVNFTHEVTEDCSLETHRTQWRSYPPKQEPDETRPDRS